MFVTTGAKEIILNKRKNQVLKKLVQEIVIEARRLNVSENELIQMIKLENEGEE